MRSSPIGFILGLALALTACGTGTTPPMDTGPSTPIGAEHNGGASYDDGVSRGSGSCGFEAVSPGPYFVGVGPDFNSHAELCGACLLVRAANGRSVVAQVVTWGVVTAPNNIDLSRSAFDALFGANAPMSPVTWAVTQCPVSGTLSYHFLSGANTDWTGLQVRNSRLPITRLEVRSMRNSNWTALHREDWNDFVLASGFGPGMFELRVTASDGQTVMDSFGSFSPGQVLMSSGQFR